MDRPTGSDGLLAPESRRQRVPDPAAGARHRPWTDPRVRGDPDSLTFDDGRLPRLRQIFAGACRLNTFAQNQLPRIQQRVRTVIIHVVVR